MTSSRDSRVPFSAAENSQYRRTEIGESSRQSTSNGLSLPQIYQIYVAPSPSQIAWTARPQAPIWNNPDSTSLLFGNGYINGPYGPHRNPNALRYSMGVQEPSPSNRAAHICHGHHLGGFGVYGTLSSHGMMLHNNLHGPVQVARGPNVFVPSGLSHFPGPRFNFYGHHQHPWLIHGQGQQMNLEWFQGRIVVSAQDPFYSCVLQDILEAGLSVLQIDSILCEVMGSLNELMKNHIGCHFALKLFWVCNHGHRTMFLQDIARCHDTLIQTCNNSTGSKSMQTILESLTSPDLIRLIISALGRAAVPLSTNPDGFRVIKCCLKKFNAEYNEVIFIRIATGCYQVATDKTGCFVLQDCIERSTGNPRELLVVSVAAKALKLAEDPYGNYVVQQLIELNIPWTLKSLSEQFKGHYASFSRNMHASHVVEKLLSSALEDADASEIIGELINSPDFSMLLTDRYAKYVVQTALSVSKRKNLPEYGELLGVVEANNKNFFETN